MALIYCPECGKQISDKAEKCVHCGYQINNIKEEQKKTKENKRGLLGLIGFLIKAILITFVILMIIAALAGSKAKSGTQTTTTNNNVWELEMDKGYQTSKIEFVITDYKFQKEVVPKNHSGYFYTKYTADDGNKYFNVRLTVKNISNETISDIFSSVTLIYKDSYEYRCFYVTEGDDGFDLFESIKPLETLEYRFLVEVPEEVYASTEESLKLVFHDGNKSYVLKIR